MKKILFFILAICFFNISQVAFSSQNLWFGTPKSNLDDSIYKNNSMIKEDVLNYNNQVYKDAQRYRQQKAAEKKYFSNYQTQNSKNMRNNNLDNNLNWWRYETRFDDWKLSY